MSNRVLVVGLGIAGMSAALALKQAGWMPVIVERAPQRRAGGYFVAMFPEGIDAAKRIGVYDDIHLRTPSTLVNWDLDDKGRRERTPGCLELPGSPEAVLRSDIEAGLWAHISGQIEVRFGTIPTAIVTSSETAIVTLRNDGGSYTEAFDLVVGADGLRSTTRRLVFGPDRNFMKPMNTMICAYQLSGNLSHLADGESAVLAEVGRSAYIFALSDTSPTMLFTWRTTDSQPRSERPPAETLRCAFSGVSGEGLIEEAIAQLDTAPQYLMDSVHQVKMGSWASGRVVLLGDSAWCLALYSGMGATMSMLGGVVLGTKISEHGGDVPAALRAFQSELRGKVRRYQFHGWLKGLMFVPSNQVVASIRMALLRGLARRLPKPKL